MTIDLPRAEPRLSDHALSTVVLLSPLSSGVVWAIVAGLAWNADMNSPDANLGTLFAAWVVLFYGFLGLCLLLIPMTIGLVSRSLLTRLAAAWVQSLLCAGTGTLIALSTLPHQWYDGPGPIGYFTIVMLFVPLVVTAGAHRRLRHATD